MEFVAYWKSWLQTKLGSTERGGALVEYAFLLALIAMVCLTAVMLVGTRTSTKFESVANQLP